MTLEASARVAGRMGRLFKIEGEVDGGRRARRAQAASRSPASHWWPVHADQGLPSGGASRLAALLVARIFPICSLLAPCQPGAALRNPVLVQREQATRSRHASSVATPSISSRSSRRQRPAIISSDAGGTRAALGEDGPDGGRLPRPPGDIGTQVGQAAEPRHPAAAAPHAASISASRFRRDSLQLRADVAFVHRILADAAPPAVPPISRRRRAPTVAIVPREKRGGTGPYRGEYRHAGFWRGFSTKGALCSAGRRQGSGRRGRLRGHPPLTRSPAKARIAATGPTISCSCRLSASGVEDHVAIQPAVHDLARAGDEVPEADLLTKPNLASASPTATYCLCDAGTERIRRHGAWHR